MVSLKWNKEINLFCHKCVLEARLSQKKKRKSEMNEVLMRPMGMSAKTVRTVYVRIVRDYKKRYNH